jgi:hypothetical protein
MPATLRVRSKPTHHAPYPNQPQRSSPQTSTDNRFGEPVPPSPNHLDVPRVVRRTSAPVHRVNNQYANLALPSSPRSVISDAGSDTSIATATYTSVDETVFTVNSRTPRGLNSIMDTTVRHVARLVNDDIEIRCLSAPWEKAASYMQFVDDVWTKHVRSCGIAARSITGHERRIVCYKPFFR